MRCAAIRIAYPAVLLGCFSAFAFGQEAPAKKDAPAPCPQVGVNTPGQRVFKEGERLTFSAALAGAEPVASPNFVWSASGGLIESGQGTRSITIDTSGAGNDRQLTVELWVGGYAPECTLQTRASVKIVPPAARALEFGELPAAQETERLTEFANQLQPFNDTIYVLGYGGRTSPRGFANATLKRIKTQLLASGIPYERLAFIDAGYHEHATFEIWIVPTGADAPRAKPSIAAKDIIFPKISVPSPGKKP